MGPKMRLHSVFLLAMLCLLILQGCKQSVGREEAVYASEKYHPILLVFHDPSCGACKRDKTLVDLMRKKVDVLVLSWSNDSMIMAYNIRKVPTYVLLYDYGRGRRIEAWRTRSATIALKLLGSL